MNKLVSKAQPPTITVQCDCCLRIYDIKKSNKPESFACFCGEPPGTLHRIETPADIIDQGHGHGHDHEH